MTLSKVLMTIPEEEEVTLEDSDAVPSDKTEENEDGDEQEQD